MTSQIALRTNDSTNNNNTHTHTEWISLSLDWSWMENMCVEIKMYPWHPYEKKGTLETNFTKRREKLQQTLGRNI